MLGREEFFNVTKLLHNALQGNPHGLTDEDWEIYDKYNKLNAKELDGDYDYVIVHDPQPAAMRKYLPDAARSLDLALPHRPLYAQPQGPRADRAARRALRLQGLPSPDLRAEWRGRQGRDRAARDRSAVAEEHGAVTRGRRLRLRPVRRRRRPAADLPGLALRPLEGPARRDRLPTGSSSRSSKACSSRSSGRWRPTIPRAGTSSRRRIEHAAGDEDIKILNNLNNVGAIEVNAFQSQADVVLQKSIREGFGLTVSEALWKGRPTIAGNVGGIPLQIQDGATGFLVNSPEEAAGARDRGPRGSRARKAPGPGRQGVRAHALPHAAPAARLAADLQRARLDRQRAPLAWRGMDAPADPAVEPRARHLRARRGRRAGAAPRRRRPRDRADRAAPPARRALDRVGDDRGGRGDEPAARRARLRRRRRGRDLPDPAGRVRPRRLRPVLQRDREPAAVVHPALSLGPLERARHPRGRAGRLGERLQGREPRPRGGGARGDRGRPRSRS